MKIAIIDKENEKIIIIFNIYMKIIRLNLKIIHMKMFCGYNKRKNLKYFQGEIIHIKIIDLIKVLLNIIIQDLENMYKYNIN